MQEQLKNCYIDDFVVTQEEDPSVKVVSHLPETKNIKIATITAGNSATDIFAPNPGSDIKIDQKLTVGKEIAAIKIDDKTPVSIYAPYFENKDINLKTVSDCANAIKQLLILLGIDESKIHTV